MFHPWGGKYPSEYPTVPAYTLTTGPIKLCLETGAGLYRPFIYLLVVLILISSE